MSRPWLQDDFKDSPKSRSRSPSERRKPRVDQFGRTLPSRSRSRSRSRSGSRGRSRRRMDGLRHSRESSHSSRNFGSFGQERSRDRDVYRSREPGRKDSRERKRSRKREGSSSSSDSDGSGSSSHTRIVASTNPKYLNARLFVANIISKEVCKDELVRHFEKYGNVVDLLIHPKNYCFIQYLKEEHAKLAVEGENGSTLKGWRLDVKMANENRKPPGAERGGFGGRGRGGDRGGRGGRGGYAGMDRDRSPLRDDPLRDPYLDPYRAGGPRGPPGRFPPPPPPGEFGLRDPYFPDPYRRGYPDPWLPPPDDPYRRDPYADPYRDPYAARPPPPPIECEIFVVSSQLRAYGEAVESRVKEHNIITAVSVIPEGRTAPQMIEEVTAQNALFAIFINPQNEMHRSLTLNILHGTPQEHRNMPLDDAITLIGRSFVQYVDGLREKANAAAAPLPSTSTSVPRVFLPASAEVAYLLNLLADNRALTIQELNTVIKYLQERRDKLIDAESRPIVADDGTVKSPPSQRSDTQSLQSPPREQTTVNKDTTQQDLASKILSIFSSAGGSIQGVPPANGTAPPKPVTGAPAPPPPPPASVASSASLINFDNPNVQKALDNLIQSSPSLLKNINTKTSMSAAQMGVPSVSTSLSSVTGMSYGQGGGMNTGEMQNSQGQNQGQMPGGMQGMGGLPGMPPMPGQGGMPPMAYGGAQGQRLSAGSQPGYGAPGQMGRGYGQQR